MKTIKNKLGKFFTSITALIGLAALASCNNETEEWFEERPETEVEEHVMVMRLVGGRTSYADKRTTASTEWTDGDVIYLRFYQADDETVVCGKAVYKATNSIWNISYYGNLATGKPYKCEAFYFTNATAKDNYNIDMQPTSCTYVDEDATYMVESGELVVSAELAPITVRLRIQGESGKTMGISGMAYRSSFNLTEKAFTSSTSAVKLTFGEDGYTPYIYVSPISVHGTSSQDFTITLDDGYYKYTKTFEKNLFTAGESGYILMPTQEVNKGWTPSDYYYPSDAIDLGLSVRWAKMNLFSQADEEPGIFCAWGDAYGTYTGTDNYNTAISAFAGDPNYDIATRSLGERWAIPTEAQWQELMDNCIWTVDWLNGVYKWTVTGPNGNTITLPMFNSVYGTNTEPATTSSSGCYWASTQYNTYSGRALYLSTSAMNWNYDSKCYRMQIRPVLVK